MTAAVEVTWPGGDSLVSRSRYVTDAKRLGDLPLEQYQRVVVVRPSALLLPAPVLRAAGEQASEPAIDVAVLSGIPPEVFYIVSARVIALGDSLAGVPGCVTLPQAVQRLAGAGASLDKMPLKVARSAALADTTSQSIAAALVPGAWRAQRSARCCRCRRRSVSPRHFVCSSSRSKRRERRCATTVGTPRNRIADRSASSPYLPESLAGMSSSWCRQCSSPCAAWMEVSQSVSPRCRRSSSE